MAGMVKRREGQGSELASTQAGGRREPLQRQTGLDPFRGLGILDPFRRMREMLSFDPFAEMEPLMTGERRFLPDMEVRETKDAYMICADVPGLKESDVSIDVSGRRLTISGKREEEQRDEGDRYWAFERSYGSFTRSFTLPEGVEPDRIDARLENGVLEVKIPKTAAEQPKRITIKGGSQEGQKVEPHGTSQTQTSTTTTGTTQGGSREKAA